MFGIFKKKNEIEFIYPDLKPADRIKSILIEYILPDLESKGFKFLKSELTFKRTIGNFEQCISFSKSKWNEGNNICKFSLRFIIYSIALQKYYKSEYQIKTGKINLRSKRLNRY